MSASTTSSFAAPCVSVVIPAYNRAKIVGRAIESALAQTFKDFEIIVVDDGSKDATPQVLESYGDKIRVITQKNSGASAARNTGIRAARGQWVAFLDSDDTWSPEKLASQLACVSTFNARVCFTRCHGDDGKSIPDVDELKPSKAVSEFLLFSEPLECIWKIQLHPQIQSLLVDRELLVKAGLFDESLHVAEDTRLIYNLAFLTAFTYVEKPLVCIYRGTDNSLTYNVNPEASRKRFSSYLRVQSEAYWRLMEKHPEHSRSLRRRMSYFTSRRAELALASGDTAQARLLARDGIGMAGDAASVARCLLIYLFPWAVRGRFQKKWYGTGAGEKVKGAEACA